jgi:thiamine-phosphate pyrophosphorylase
MRKNPCQLYLTIEATEAAVARLAAVLAAAPVAAVLIAPSGARPLDAASARPLVELAQAKGVAALIHADADLVRALRADGVHLPASLQIAVDYAEARDILGLRYMVGADAGSSRHDAMELAEAGADYVAFSIHAEAEPLVPEDDDDPEVTAALNEDRELIGWWVDIFETPCVAMDIKTADEAASVAASGCEFVSLTLDPGMTPAACADLARAIAYAMTHLDS